VRAGGPKYGQLGAPRWSWDLTLSALISSLPLAIQPWGLALERGASSMSAEQERGAVQGAMGVAPAQIVMNGFVALHDFPSLPPNSLWSCKGQST